MENESLKQYYISTNKIVPNEVDASDGRLPHFNILRHKNCFSSLSFMRRDYYKIVLTTTKAILQTENGEVSIDRPALFFASPERLFGWTYLYEAQWGFTILFNGAYLHNETKEAFRTLFSLFSEKEYPFLFLENEDFDKLSSLLQMMHDEYQSCFALKDYLINNFLVTIAYMAVKIKNVPMLNKEKSNSVFGTFCAMLENQFPIDSPNVAIEKTAPKDFANALGVHVNYLNALVKQETGKTTSEIIGDRILLEAINLLKHSNWSISEIAECLGYDYAQHFHHFFKKRTGVSPKSYRDDI